ncbi:MAG TPA: response regulator [Solirubrobacteraceae bacterium]|nr:response regulator [Solirubrobacteraceae bacterium]
MNQLSGAPILVLEDERATGTLITQLLAGARFSNPVQWLRSGADALAYLERATRGEVELPVICVLDLMLPDVTGLDLLRRIRTTPQLAHLPVIMLTGSGHDEDIEAAYALGIDAYLIKPAGVHGLPDVVRELNLGYQLMPHRGQHDV